ncbi:uncharacterized protein BO95DRAFT_434136 [Aspergillus brunneoviolaceus CBS 621.78]|uniref:Uncharacterized protein n=1 Tax=Aspergillus brunneoviolaceus CBS 621.78 TaxID=1450534 RepID=A0ACD1G242_9EURO|nr:hypothetical protein BO95DRAFT_434136 [Aspergillus brunneoviolaceus CBS 621.78]RAH43283.1 hypothetical protein BO95DRAFT_434136 [Aspergillus brunneoviolaceus CBS 621.78]
MAYAQIRNRLRNTGSKSNVDGRIRLEISSSTVNSEEAVKEKEKESDQSYGMGNGPGPIVAGYELWVDRVHGKKEPSPESHSFPSRAAVPENHPSHGQPELPSVIPINVASIEENQRPPPPVIRFRDLLFSARKYCDRARATETRREPHKIAEPKGNGRDRPETPTSIVSYYAGDRSASNTRVLVIALHPPAQIINLFMNHEQQLPSLGGGNRLVLGISGAAVSLSANRYISEDATKAFQVGAALPQQSKRLLSRPVRFLSLIPRTAQASSVSHLRITLQSRPGWRFL